MRKRIFFWLGTLVLALAALALFPSAASVALLLAAALLLPLPRWQELLKERLLLYGQLKAVTAAALFVCGAALALAGPLQTMLPTSAPVSLSAAANDTDSDADSDSSAPSEGVSQTPDTALSTQPSVQPSAEPSAEPSAQPSAEPSAESPSEPSARPSPESSASAAPQPTPSTANSTSQGVVKEYVLNTSSKKFHLPTCSSVKQMNESNKTTFSGTREELIAQGYTPCGNCNP